MWLLLRYCFMIEKLFYCNNLQMSLKLYENLWLQLLLKLTL